jgi:transcriptional regulator with XRE-family HTH domain
MSLREFGKKLGDPSAAFLSDVELGRRHPSDKVLANMARALSTSFEDLKAHDIRPMVEGVKRLVAEKPAYAFAFRKAVDKGLTPQDIEKLADRKGKPRRS